MLNGWEEIMKILEGEVGVNCFSIFDFGILSESLLCAAFLLAF